MGLGVIFPSVNLDFGGVYSVGHPVTLSDVLGRTVLDDVIFLEHTSSNFDLLLLFEIFGVVDMNVETCTFIVRVFFLRFCGGLASNCPTRFFGDLAILTLKTWRFGSFVFLFKRSGGYEFDHMYGGNSVLSGVSVRQVVGSRDLIAWKSHTDA